MIRSSFSSSSIFRWIRDELASRVKVIDSVSGLTRNWLQIRHSDDHIMRTSVVLISRLETPPLLLSALAIKFNGRAVFGMYRVNGKHDRIQIRGINFDFPVCAISLSNDSVYLFGKQAGETFNFRSMELLMKSFNPEMNDLFVLSLILVNVVVSMDLFWIRCSKAWKYVVYWLIQAVKTNCFLFFVWLSILTICGLPSVRPVLNACLCWMQSIACTHFAAIVRHDAAIYYHRLPVIFAAYVVSCIAVVAVRQKFFSRPGVFDDDHLFREWSPLESTILSYILFRPIGMSMPPTATLIQSNLEDGMEQLIERLAFPNLWLQDDLISNEYINSLPVWLHTEAIHPESGSNNEESADHRSSSVSESELGASSPTSKSSQPRGSCQSFQSSIPVKYSPTKSLRKRNVSAGSRSKAAAPAQVHESSQRDVGPESAAPVGSISSSECAICLETYRQNQILCGLPCGHSYHESCILSWLLRDNHICPTCRWPSNRAKIR